MVSSCDHHHPLTEDLLIEILARLPVKSLLRFQCVSTYWYALIKNPSFVSKHFHRPNNHTMLLVYYQFHDSTMKRALAAFPDEPPVHHQYIDYDYLQMSQTLCDIHGPLNGLFLLNNFDSGNPWSHRVTLWNPATKGCSLLPVPSFNLPPDAEPWRHQFGFGLDPLTNDYKVVWIQQVHNEILQYLPDLALAAVYSPCTNFWRQLDPLLVSIFDLRSGAYLDGAYYWVSCVGEDYYTLVLFDMGSDVFREIKAPPSLSKFTTGDLVLHNGDSIALLIYEYTVEYIDLWVMKTEGCWTKHFTIGPLQDVLRPIGLWKNDEIIVETRSHLPQTGIWLNDGSFRQTNPISQLAIYNLNSHEIKNLGIHGRYFVDIFYYRESVASVKRRGII